MQNAYLILHESIKKTSLLWNKLPRFSVSIWVIDDKNKKFDPFYRHAMKYTLKAFGITKDILGGKEVTFEMEGHKVGELKQALIARYPDIESLNSLFIAVNNAYAADDTTIAESDEIALIPPVSGG